MGQASGSPFQKGLIVVQRECKGWLTAAHSSRHSIPRHPGSKLGRGGGVEIILLLLKHIEEKQHIGLWQEEEKISMTAGSNAPLTIWKLGPLSFHESFFFFFNFLSSHLPFPLTLKQLSSHHYSAHSFNLSSFVCSIPPIVSPPLYQSLVPPFPLSWPYYLCSSTSCEPLTTTRPTDFAVWKLCAAPPSLPILSYILLGVLWL